MTLNIRDMTPVYKALSPRARVRCAGSVRSMSISSRRAMRLVPLISISRVGWRVDKIHAMHLFDDGYEKLLDLFRYAPEPCRQPDDQRALAKGSGIHPS